MNEKKIFTRKMALFLRKQGLKILRTEPNTHKPQFDVYVFKDTPELRVGMEEYMELRHYMLL